MCLNQSVKLGVPAKWAVAGSAADFLIVVSPLPNQHIIIPNPRKSGSTSAICQAGTNLIQAIRQGKDQAESKAKTQSIYSIATTPGLNPLFPALTISISNISPHLRNIGVQASTRLMQLFKAFSTPSFLLADEGHPRLVYYLLETINSILYHQFNGMSPLTSLLSNIVRIPSTLRPANSPL
jgi:hypothetical protein